MKDVYRVIGNIEDIYRRTAQGESTLITVESMSRDQYEQITDRRLIDTDLSLLVNKVNAHLLRFIANEHGPQQLNYTIKRIP